MIIKRYINGRPLPTSDNKPKEATPAKKQTVKPNNAPPSDVMRLILMLIQYAPRM